MRLHLVLKTTLDSWTIGMILFRYVGRIWIFVTNHATSKIYTHLLFYGPLFIKILQSGSKYLGHKLRISNKHKYSKTRHITYYNLQLGYADKIRQSDYLLISDLSIWTWSYIGSLHRLFLVPCCRVLWDGFLRSSWNWKSTAVSI